MKTKYVVVFSDGFDISCVGFYPTIDEANQVLEDEFNAYGGNNVPEEWINDTYLGVYGARICNGVNVFSWSIIEVPDVM